MSKISKAMEKAERENERGQTAGQDGGRSAGFADGDARVGQGTGDFVESDASARRTPPPLTAEVHARTAEAYPRAAEADPRTARTDPRTARTFTPPENEEQYHALASEVYLALPDTRSRVIMVTSAVAGEGTSTIAREFAETLARSNEVGTLLVDANLRKPGHHRTFRLQRDPGLTDAVLGGLSVEQCIQQTAVPNLSVMAVGRRVVAPPRVFAAGGLDDLIGQLRRSFPLTVIDTPPVVAFSEGLQLAGRVDGVVLVIRAGRTKRQLVELAVEQLRDAGANMLGTVLNRRRFYIPRVIYERL
ncbi:CpsD/CapB family tyrosine-protein kinase [bacterium]|nr:CpsD/CapB family tyrosine-protein kinase [bacterium]